MKSAQQIITDLYHNKELDDCVKKVVDRQHRQDFKQELFLILLENPDKIVTIEQRNQLIYYVVRIILNLSRQTRNVFHKKYLDQKVVYDTDKLHTYSEPENDIEERKRREEAELIAVKEVHELDNHFGTFYYREMVKTVAKYGSMRETGRRTGIPVCSISRAIKKVRQHLTK